MAKIIESKLQDLMIRVTLKVYSNPGLTGREISNLLISDGVDTSKKEVNQILYSFNVKGYFWKEVDSNLRPSWYLTDKMKSIMDSLSQNNILEKEEQVDLLLEKPVDEKYPAYLQLYQWQLKALEAWENANCIGVIEAVTGTGKTRVALAAIDRNYRQGRKTAVIVPTLELQRQWIKVIEKDIIEQSELNLRVGQLGGGMNDSLDNNDVLVATATSASNNCLNIGDYAGLLIADECHRYGGPQWAMGLKKAFSHRLGLTATYERTDNGLEEHLNPYFHEICYSLGYDEALADGIIADFKIAFIGFDFLGSEREEYDEANRQCIDYRRKLIEKFGVTAEPFGDFMREVNVLAKGGGEEATLMARYYISNFNKRRQVLSNCSHKNTGLKLLAPAVKEAERTIVFTQTKDAASYAVSQLRSTNVNAAMLDATMGRYERRDILLGFEDGEHEVVAAPMLLDEGIDVPAADLAIIVASSRNKRQMIQRMGRVLRKKSDGRLARIAIFYIKGTSEDPENGAHGTYIDLITSSAAGIKNFDVANIGPDEICDYLNDWEGID